MSILTVWQSPNSIRLHQLSDDPADGTSESQIAHLAALEVFQGYTCVSSNYTGPYPGEPLAWNGTDLVLAE